MVYCVQAECLYLPIWENLQFGIGGKGLNLDWSSLDNITTSARQKLIQEMAAHPGDKPSDEERESIKEKHSKLTKELLEVRGKVHHLEKEIKAVQKEILEAGCNILCVFLVETVHFIWMW